MGTPFFWRGGFTLSLSLSRFGTGVAFNYRPQKPQRIFIFNSSFNNGKENFVIDIIKKLLNIAFQYEAITCVVFRDSSHYSLQNRDAFVRAESDATRERCRDKRRLENRIEHRRYSMMEDSVSDCRLVDVPLLGITDVKTFVRAVFVCFVFQIPMQLKNILFQIPLEALNVRLVPFISLKGIPRQEQILGRYYYLE